MYSPGDDNKWEYVKENAAPLERGRDVRSIKKMFDESSAIVVSREERERNETKKLQFERLIQHSENAWRDSEDDSSDDPLVHWLAYIKFIQDTYPADTQQSFLLMERCTRAFMGKTRYANDVRFIRVCILYADRTTSPMEVYKYLHSRQVGFKTALYWVAWAWVSEKAGDYAFADKIFKKALLKDAEPKKILEERHRQFQRRMSRHWLNASSGGDEDESNNENLTSSSGGLRRSRLTTISAPVASSNYRLPAVDEDSVVPNTMSFSKNRSTNVAKSGAFSVYIDETDDVREPLDKLQISSFHQKRQSKLATESERKKENTLSAEQWSVRGGLTIGNSAPGGVDVHEEARSSRGTRATTSSAPKFEIFVEDIDQNSRHCNNSFNNLEKKSETAQRSIRERLDDNNMIGNLAKNPLHYIQNPSTYATDKKTTDKKKLEPKENNRVSSNGASKNLKTSISNHPCLQNKAESILQEEQCLEELRAAKKFYNLASCTIDFSALVSIEEDSDSCMSLEEVDCSMNRSTEMDDSKTSNNPSSSNKKVGGNDSIPPFYSTNQYIPSSSVNDSHASSTVNERDAVGGILRAEEETINTRFARAEMSLMFSSPVEQDSQYSLSKSLFSAQQSTNRKTNASVLDISAIPVAESHQKNLFSCAALATAPVTSLGGLFDIYCDKNLEENAGQKFESRKSNAQSGFDDNNGSSEDQHGNDPLLDSQQAIESGCTASFSVFGDLMDAVSGSSYENLGKTIAIKSTFSIFEDKPNMDANSERRDSASCVYYSHAEVHNDSVTYSLAQVVLGKDVLDCRHMLLPSGLRSQSKATIGLKVSLLNDNFLVKNELGRGAHGTVLLCNNMKDSDVALKVQSPTGCLAHEFHILSCLEKRMKSKRGFKMITTNIFPRPLHFVAHGDGGLLAMTTASRSGINLIDLVNLYLAKEDSQVPELIALYYVSQMLQHLEILHSNCNILHCDVKPDNWVLTKTNACDSVEGSDLLLVDFGRSVDLEALDGALPHSVKFKGRATTKDMECVTMREGRSWSLDLDTYGLCASAYVMLFGSHMEVYQVSTTKVWRTSKPLRRYWNRALWNLLFEKLLNGGIEESQPKKLREIRSLFEAYLDEDNRRQHLAVLLKHQAAMLPKIK